jgi:sugar lactone lactonase YvrE
MPETRIVEPANLRTVVTGLFFPEGPIALTDGSVLVVEIARSTLTRVDPDGETSVVAECGGGPNGAAIGPDGAVYVCNNGVRQERASDRTGRTAYVTLSGTGQLVALDWPRPGGRRAFTA